jgi:hypothetical protein
MGCKRLYKQIRSYLMFGGLSNYDRRNGEFLWFDASEALKQYTNNKVLMPFVILVIWRIQLQVGN